jgi:hypothetical protein
MTNVTHKPVSSSFSCPNNVFLNPVAGEFPCTFSLKSQKTNRRLSFAISSVLISGFRRDVNEICALPGHYAAYSGNSLPKFRSHLQGILGIIDPF